MDTMDMSRQLFAATWKTVLRAHDSMASTTNIRNCYDQLDNNCGKVQAILQSEFLNSHHRIISIIEMVLASEIWH